MAKQYTSSPGPTDVRQYQSGQGAYQSGQTAFQSISTDVMLNQQTLATDPYIKYLEASSNPAAAAVEFNKIYAGLVNTQEAGYSNAWEKLQTLLRANKYSDGKSAIGIVDSADRTGLAKAIQDSLAMGQSDVIQFLTALSASGGRGGGPKQVDTTTKFVTQTTRALQLKDKGDAMRTLTDAYMLAYGTAPSMDLITDFEKQWNAEIKAQTPTTTTRTVTKMVPVYDSKTGKQKIGKNGKPMFKPLYNAEDVRQYEPVSDIGTATTGEGFTDEEQKAFMANYIATNYPVKNWNVDQIGGAAKTLYDAIVQVSNNNYEKPPTFEEASSMITKIMATGNEQVAGQLLQQYVASIRGKAAKRFMSLAPDIAAGNDANAIVNDYATRISQALERSVDVEDPLMLRILNYQDAKGNYRMPNDFELTQMIMADPRRAQTSAAKNEAVNLAQSLRSQLQIG